VCSLSYLRYDTYFPWVDNVYSHRTSQSASKRGLVTRYFDCRLKGRPSGTPKSQDPNKKKRKRTARPLDLCDVRIKITEYPAGSAGELMAVGHTIGLDTDLVKVAVSRIQDRPFRVIQRNGTIGNGDDGLAIHRHDLQKSDETKKSTALRYLAGREKEAKRNQKPSPWKPRGNAAATARDHSGDADIKFYSACFCPFSQRVWIALEAMGFKYQYCETDPLRKPKPTPLLEANPRGLVPAIWQGGWACAESSVILEYLEDTNSTIPLHPTIPKLKAICRLWIDFINTRIVPSFSGALLATVDEARSQHMEMLQHQICELTQAADEKGPYFLGDQMCLVDVHLAPFALRLSRLAPFRGLNLQALPARWKGWLDALEQNPHVRSTMSTDALYAQSMNDLLKGFRGISD
jgi:glutathione S-transferase